MPAKLKSYWLPIHVSVVSLGSGVFLVSGVASILFLLKLSKFAEPSADGVLARVRPGCPTRRPWTGSPTAPPFLFPVFGFGVDLWCDLGRGGVGRYWGWDPKETVSFITWVIYAAYLHARVHGFIGGMLQAWINVVGFVAMVFNLFINLVTVGLHSYAGCQLIFRGSPIVVGSDDPGGGPMGLRADGPQADIGQHRDNDDEQQVKHSRTSCERIYARR